MRNYDDKEKFVKSFKSKLYRELTQSGFKFKRKELIPPDLTDKDSLRRAHRAAREHLLMKNKKWILNNECRLIDNFATAEDIIPEKISPELQLVDTQEKADLFRYASYLWSIPLSNGFGRRLRYLVIDKSNKKLIGLIGLTDPMIGLGVRDTWIGWPKEQKENMLWHVMDAYTFGAVQPYNYLLGGKLIATLMASNQIRKDFKKKYSHGKSVIRHKQHKRRGADLALITTTGAFGKSSILDRLMTFRAEIDDPTYNDVLYDVASGIYKDEGIHNLNKRINDKEYSQIKPLWEHVGFTEGWGFFHLNNGIATDLYEYLKAVDDPVVKQHRFGQGANWKMRVIRRGLKQLGLNYKKYAKHGVQRGFYAAPLAKNYMQFLNGKDSKPKYYNYTTEDLFGFFRERYLLPRANADQRWKTYDRDKNVKLSYTFVNLFEKKRGA